MNGKLIKVTVTGITQATPRIKIFKLTHNYPSYHFIPGQWIDLHAPIEGKNIGGYTIISSPEDKNFIELAIRESDFHPVTQFMHKVVQLNTKLFITEGQGKFFLAHDTSPVIFIAGGIGITPIISMMRSLANSPRSFELFYSASLEKDFLLINELRDHAHFFVTKEKCSLENAFYNERITTNHIKKSVVNYKEAQYYICGPKQMIDSFVLDLKSMGISKEQLFYEKWW